MYIDLPDAEPPDSHSPKRQYDPGVWDKLAFKYNEATYFGSWGDPNFVYIDRLDAGKMVTLSKEDPGNGIPVSIWTACSLWNSGEWSQTMTLCEFLQGMFNEVS